MKFINKRTGAIYETNNEFVISQFKKNEDIEEFVEKVKVEKPKEETQKKVTKKSK